jgi:hypothetical protein
MNGNSICKQSLVGKGINYENKLALTLNHSHKDKRKNPKKELVSDISLGFRRDNILKYLISKNKDFQFFKI